MHPRIRVLPGTLVALIAALTAACSATGHSASPAARDTAASTSSAQPAFDEGPVPSFVPRRYVTLGSPDFKRLSVRDTVTGRVTATVSAPRGMDFTGVFGTGTGRAFLIDATQDPPTTMSGDNLFLLRLGPGSAPLPLVSLRSIGSTYQPVSVRAALSPDGTKIAIAYSGVIPRRPLTIYSTTSGKVVRSWTMSSGMISSGDLMTSGDLQQNPDGTSMRWSADGRGLAYAFHSGTGTGTGTGPGTAGYERYASIRLLDTTKPGSDLLANSRILAGAEPGYNPGNGAGTQCLTSNGWSLSADGQAVTCAAQWIMPSTRSPGSVGIPSGGACPATGKHVYVGFWRSYWLPGGGGGAGPVYGPCPAGFRFDAQLYWASPDGRIVLGTMDYPGHAMFGLFSANRTFISLAPPPARLDSLAW